ncbi:DUF2637 domain-containing protein [Streptomyces lunaelactis]|uniref:DUF2637 domain-containing protein n=1 Tax=Streptomyces lunaelactis TaxID=1535768 RepID=UPI001584AE13|nr:DUF2637 domain-containing protein [Streptomyces lunaelactis]NUK08656.1 DUF2637 domain-containing protein [Streptomyces lunaelactis]NUL10747.1 DUF2637 domain-containing protein [Streptomyces lunaelactis]NUL22573.1 DUF2637 domain-containing protein [Streptomyces lunaelactis]
MNRTGKVLLIAALAAVVGMAFRVSWNALSDVARAVGADDTGATLYPFVVDGLMALALVATLVLTDQEAKGQALKVLAGYTVASLVLNFVHGAVPELHGETVDWGQLADWEFPHYALILLATSLPVGSIYFGSDLVAKVIHHRPAPSAVVEKSARATVNRLGSDLRESIPVPPAAVGELPAAESADPLPAIEPAAPVESAPVKAVAAVEHAPRRATGRVPESARTPRPTRTPDELLSQARSVTADWSDEALTAEAIRKAVRTSSASARTLRDALKAERAERDVPAEAVV